MEEDIVGIFSELKILSYSFSRIYPNGSRKELWMNVHACEEIMLKKRYISDIYTPDLYQGDYSIKPFYIPLHLNTLESKHRIQYEKVLNVLRDTYGYTRPLNIVKKNEDNTDYHVFYISHDVSSAVNHYLYNIDKLYSILGRLERYAQLQISLGCETNVFPKGKRIQTTLTNKRLSPSEARLLDDIYKGKLYKNNTVGLSEQSAKVYIHRIKNKLGIKSKNELISYYTRHIVA